MVQSPCNTYALCRSHELELKLGSVLGIPILDLKLNTDDVIHLVHEKSCRLRYDKVAKVGPNVRLDAARSPGASSSHHLASVRERCLESSMHVTDSSTKKGMPGYGNASGPIKMPACPHVHCYVFGIHALCES